MLLSKQIERRQSEIRQELAVLAGKEKPSEDEVRSLSNLDGEYQTNEQRYRAAVISEDQERREAGQELETREGKQWNDLIHKFELRQVAAALSETDAKVAGETAEVISELRNSGQSFEGFPVPWEALEARAGETVASGTPDPITTAPIIDRLFPDAVASRMGGRMISIPFGEREYPVVTSSVSAGWQATETGDVPGPTAFATTDRPLKPDHTLGISMTLTRKTIKQSGGALEQAVRRDMNSAIAQELDKATFLGTGSNGQPTGLITGGNSVYGMTETAIDAGASYAAFRSAAVRFMTANAASSLSQIRLMMRPEVFDGLDGDLFDAGSGMTEWDRLSAKISNTVLSSNALSAPTGSPTESTALLTTATGGVAPFFLGMWGAVDLIRDPYSTAKSGAVQLTALATMDVTVARPAQIEILTGLQ